jgi:hypothetical protein
VGERSFPYSIWSTPGGDRFANESESYVDLGHHMLEHDKAGPYWLIADARHAEGLYSAGNNSASVMGRTYPGPGSTIGPAVVFGLRAARHMARRVA